MRLLRLLAMAVAAVPAFAAPTEPFSLFGISAGKGVSGLSMPMQVLISLTLLTVLPGAIMAMTPFLRITIVLHFLRQALGTQTVPSNQVLLGLALFLTIVIMQPVAADMYHQGWEPMEAGQITGQQAMDQAAVPLRTFMLRFAREKDVRLFLEIAHKPAPHARRPGSRSPHSGLHPVRNEDRLSDRGGAVPAVSGNRPGGSLLHALDGHDATASGDDLGPVQDHAVRPGGRMEPGDRISHEELLPMTPDSVVQIVREALMLAFWVAAPMLAIGFLVGIVVSLVQIATSMQDTAFSTVPRLIAFLTGILLLLPWMLQRTMSYTAAVFGDLGRYAR